MISIIVPVYNNEKKLSRCLDSILSQTYTDIEVLLINDGSTDNTIKICNAYKEMDSRIKVFNISNSGVSAARNLGIANASGEYIGFVDSDDYIDSSMYEKLLKQILNHNSDICFTEYYLLTGSGKKPIVMKEKHMLREEIVDYFLPKFISSCSLDGNHQTLYIGSLCRCLFKREVIVNSQIRLRNELSYGEDLIFLIETLLVSTSVDFVTQPLYYYVRNESKSTTQQYIDGLDQQIVYLSDILRTIISEHLDTRYLKSYNMWKLISFITLIKNLCRRNSGYSISKINKMAKEYEKLLDISEAVEYSKVYELYCVPRLFRNDIKKGKYLRFILAYTFKEFVDFI